MKEDFPSNEVDFDRRFHSEKACLEYLLQLRWPEGFRCTRCGHCRYWTSSRGLFFCCQCEHQHSATSGTIFHGARKPLRLWFKALWWISTRKNGVNATALQDLLGLRSYQTAWCWLQKLRTCTIFPDRTQLSGSVEVDECFFGGAHSGKRGRGAAHKCKVAIAVERNGRKLGRLRMQVIDSCSADELIAFVKTNISAKSHVTTDGWGAYNDLKNEGYVHKAIVQSQNNDKDSVLPGVHLVASLAKRVVLGTFHGQFDTQYLQRYLDEYVFRFNRRNCRSVGKRFWRIVQRAAQSDPMPLKKLVLDPVT